VRAAADAAARTRTPGCPSLRFARMDARRFAAVAGFAAAALAATATAATAAPGLGVTVTGAQPFERGLVALSGDRLRIRTQVREATPGSDVVIRVLHGEDVLHTSRHDLRGGDATVRDSLRLIGPGAVTVRVRLVGGYGEAQARHPALRVSVLQPTAGPGASGLRVRFLQRRLADLRYAVRHTGRYDWATKNAVIAFRKVNRMRRVGNASRAVFSRVARGRGAFRPRRRGPAHVEGDLSSQVLALVDRGGEVFRVYMTSSGRPGLRTPTGTHRFYRKSAGWNSSGMLDSAYFTHPGGPRTACAIHGYFVVPTWNASHCCFRVPIPDARLVFDWVRIGQRIHVYY
jgi:lipoprotein-anchoring transpeptidase ErfK/SrfK